MTPTIKPNIITLQIKDIPNGQVGCRIDTKEPLDDSRPQTKAEAIASHLFAELQKKLKEQ